MFKIFLISMLSFLLTGCFGFLKPEVQYKDKFIVGKPADDMIKDCVASAPPTKDEYLKLTPAEKEKTLFDYSNALLTDIKVCNAQWDTFRKWQLQQEKIYAPLELKP